MIYLGVMEGEKQMTSITTSFATDSVHWGHAVLSTILSRKS